MTTIHRTPGPDYAPDCAPTAGSPTAGSPAGGQTSDAGFSVSVVIVDPQVSWLCAIGKLAGESTAAQLAGVLEQQRAAGCRFVRLDLSQVPMLDHAGFDVLVEAHQGFLHVGGTLVLTGVGPRIARLFELTGLDQTLFMIARATDPPPSRTDSAAQPRVARHYDARGRASAGSEREVVDRAIGVVMGRAGCGVAEATDRLALLGRATGRSLVAVAQSILDAPSRPGATATYKYRAHSRARATLGAQVAGAVRS